MLGEFSPKCIKFNSMAMEGKRIYKESPAARFRVGRATLVDITTSYRG
jgi:hypothetical protein